MKKAFTTVALFAVLGTMAVSCQKDYHLLIIGYDTWHDRWK